VVEVSVVCYNFGGFQDRSKYLHLNDNEWKDVPKCLPIERTNPNRALHNPTVTERRVRWSNFERSNGKQYGEGFVLMDVASPIPTGLPFGRGRSESKTFGGAQDQQCGELKEALAAVVGDMASYDTELYVTAGMRCCIRMLPPVEMIALDFPPAPLHSRVHV
jgi:hypothetical protein